MTSFKMQGLCGVDVCYPGELHLTRQARFKQEELTYTGTSISNADLDCIKHDARVRIDCDALSTIKRLGERW